ncbi:NADP-dependent oxidoreductase domain-containing protein [Mycena floridula]|nr:NADP-dependent oxidoreductase domain-containing protein [Mycena floridula]
MATVEPTIKAVYTQLGNSRLKISVPVIGAMGFGSSKWGGWPLDEEESIKVLKAAWDAGINTIDTANMYSNGESERIIAKFIKKYEIPRSQIIIASKCYGVVSDNGLFGLLMPELNNTRRYVNYAGLSRGAILNAVEESLQRLDTPYIDILQIHRYDPSVPPEETMKALHDLVQLGKVHYIGASSMRAWQFAHLNEIADKHNWTKFISMQNEYSLLYREEEREMIPYCKSAHQVASSDLTIAPTGFESVRKDPGEVYYSDVDKAISTRVEEIAKKKDQTMAQMALAWVRVKVSSPILGVSSVKRLDEAVDSSLILNEQEIKYLEEPYVPKPIRGHD